LRREKGEIAGFFPTARKGKDLLPQKRWSPRHSRGKGKDKFRLFVERTPRMFYSFSMRGKRGGDGPCALKKKRKPSPSLSTRGEKEGTDPPWRRKGEGNWLSLPSLLTASGIIRRKRGCSSPTGGRRGLFPLRETNLHVRTVGENVLACEKGEARLLGR